MKRMRAASTYLLLSGVSTLAMSMIFTALTAYYVTDVGMSPLQLVLVGTAIELTCFIFEVPTGVVADIYSRRLSVLIGGFLIGTCYLITGLAPLFFAIVIAEVIRGIGETFISGAREAWITDEVGADNVGPLFLRTSQVRQMCGLVGVLISIVLASVAGYAAAILLGAVINIALFGFLVFAMPEDHFTRPAREASSQSSLRQHAGDMKHTFRAGALLIRATPVLLLLVAVELFFGASSEGFDRLWEASFLTGFNMPVLSLPVIGPLAPIAWFGVFEVISTVLGLTVLEVARRRINTDNHVSLTRVLMGSYTVAILATLAFAFTGNFALAAAMVILRDLAFGLAGPIQGTWLNQSITDSRVRATVLSMNSQANALGQIAGGPGVGAIGNLFGIRAAIAVAALLLTPTLALFGRTLRRKSLTAPAADLEVVI